MKRFMSVAGLSAVLLGAHAVAAEPTSPAPSKRQVNACMAKRMAADRILSYNNAMRACKERLQPAKDALASNSPAETGSKAR
jgi:hypothetical protein